MASLSTLPIPIPNQIGSVQSLLAQVYYSTITPAVIDPGTNGPWRPPQWTKTPSLSMTATDPTTGQQTAYVFDSNIRVEHEQQTVITLNPVQTGAALSDHAYIQPSRVTLEIMMSDAMQSFTVGQWATGPSKSVSCYQTLVAIQEARNPVQLATRLRNYANMIVTEVRAVEDKDTQHSLKAHITFQHILTASVQMSSTNSLATTGGTSALPQTTGQTLNGQVQTLPVPSSVITQNNIQNATNSLKSVIGGVPLLASAGSWSSTNINSISSVFGG